MACEWRWCFKAVACFYQLSCSFPSAWGMAHLRAYLFPPWDWEVSFCGGKPLNLGVICYLTKLTNTKAYQVLGTVLCHPPRAPLHPSTMRAQSYLTLWDPMDCSPPGSSIHGISQARILEWIAIPFSRGSSWPRDQTHVFSIGRQTLYHHVIWEAHCSTCIFKLV